MPAPRAFHRSHLDKMKRKGKKNKNWEKRNEEEEKQLPERKILEDPLWALRLFSSVIFFRFILLLLQPPPPLTPSVESGQSKLFSFSGD